MNVEFTRELPDGNLIQVVVNTEQIIWLQPHAKAGRTVLFVGAGPEITVLQDYETVKKRIGS